MKKIISFDIDTVVASKILTRVPDVYEKISLFLESNGFQHIQGSVYRSLKNMKKSTVINIVTLMYQKHPYMKKCIRDVIIANVDEFHSLNYLGDYDGTPGKYAMENTIKTKDGPIPKEDFKEYALHSPSPKLLYNKNSKGVRSPEITK